MSRLALHSASHQFAVTGWRLFLPTTAMDCSKSISLRCLLRAVLVAFILAGGLAGCSVDQSPQPTTLPAEDFSSLSPILTTDQPYAIPAAPITPENADRLARVGEMAGLGLPVTLASSQDGRLLAVGTSRGVYLYGAQRLDQRRFLEAPSVKFVSISPDGRLLAAYIEARPHQVRVWRLDNGAPVGRLDIQPPRSTTLYPAGLTFSPDAEQVYAAYHNFRREHTILAWRPGEELTGREVFGFNPGFGWEANLARLIIAPARAIWSSSRCSGRWKRIG